MLSFLDPPEIILIIVVVLVLFGGSQLPKLAKNLGKAQKEFKDGLSEGQRLVRPPKRRLKRLPTTQPVDRSIVAVRRR